MMKKKQLKGRDKQKKEKKNKSSYNNYRSNNKKP